MSKRELIAAVQHAIWSHWMKYLFSQCYSDPMYPGCLIIPDDKVERWKRQLETPYAELTSKEQESDRHQADKILEVLEEPADTEQV